MGKKVLVGMSGGVDSSVAALILKEQGYEVMGCTLRLYDNGDIGEDSESGCCSLDDVSDAESVCRKIGIDHITLNFTDRFRERVMRPFAEGYIKGEIPNPCVECNRRIKFDMMLRQAELLGFDLIATGHYAGTRQKDGKWQLIRPADKKKDQTYVLCFMTQYQLAHTVFPLWGTEKARIREIAGEKGLINSRKPDSQDICFVPTGDYAGFIERFSGYSSEEGDFISEDGEVMGRHSGYIKYTIGQRKGLGAAFGQPVYVTGKNPRGNTVTLSARALTAKSVYLREFNMISGETLTEPTAVSGKIRYNSAEQSAVIYPPDERGLYRVEFDEPVKNPAAGQTCALYCGERVIGGGIINGIKEADGYGC